MDQSPNLSLSYVMPAQAQKHIVVNETFRRLDALVQLCVRSRTTAAEPATPAEGDAYILPASASGVAWDDFDENNIAAFQDGVWVEIAGVEGMRAWVVDDAALAAFDGANWSEISGGGGGSSETANKFGVNTTADTTNRLAVKSDAVLFNYDDVTPGNDDCQVKINKKTAADTGSLLFQTGASGRAEIGLLGDDDFTVKTSTDGSTWKDLIKADATLTHVSLPQTNQRLGIGVDGPENTLHLKSTGPVIRLEDDGTGAAHTGFIGFYDGAAGLKGYIGYASSSNEHFYIRNAHSAGDILFITNGSQRGYVDSGGGFVVGSPSGGAKGVGTLNAQAVYDDNALLSCYVFDQALDGNIDAAKWDGRVPDRRIQDDPESTAPERIERRDHAPMRKFAERIGGKYDPLTLDGYAKHWREKRHLTAMPNEATFDPEAGMPAGEWIQRLVETVEIQAVLIEQLNARVKTLEGVLPKQRPGR